MEFLTKTQLFSNVTLPKPTRPFFSSGPCVKPLGWGLEVLDSFLMGRSHRAPAAVGQLQDILARTRALLEIPDSYEVAIVPASATGAIEAGLWNLLGPRGVDTWVFDVFSQRWWTDLTHQLGLDVRTFRGSPQAVPDLSQASRARDQVITWGGTSSGLWIPDGQFISPDHEGLVLCDATSVVFTRPLPWEALDFTAFSWQKGLGGEAGFGMIVVSPRALDRLRTYRPSWPLPRVLNLREDPLVVEGEAGRSASLFSAMTLNTVSLLAVADCVWCLQWAQAQGGLGGLCRRVAENFHLLEGWVARTPWVGFLVHNPRWRSHAAVCLEITHPRVKGGPVSQRWAFVQGMGRFLAEQGAAFDCLNHAAGEPCLRLWCGPTVEAEDVARVLPWLEEAFHHAFL